MTNNYIFIDAQNLNLGIINQGWKLDFKRFNIYLKDKYKAKIIFIFIGFVKENKKLYDFLKLAGYTIIFKPTIKHNNKDQMIHLKGNVDAELVLQSMIEYNNYCQAILISGDGDFYCLIKYLLGKQKLLKIIIPDCKSYSSLLKKFMAQITFMNSLRQKLEYKKPC